MTDYKLQLERLKRHYLASNNYFDLISFLDLSHTLRLWTEVKDGVMQAYNDPVFKKGILTRATKRILAGSEYTYSFLPDGVTTSANKTGEVRERNILHGPSTDKYSVATLLKSEKNGDLTIAQFLMVYRVLSPEEVKTLSDESKKVPIQHVDYTAYMASPAIHFQFSGHDPKHISNEELIKRIANEYEASHADLNDTKFDLSNVFSDPVKKLMKYGCAQLPLPYFVLLHIAKNIIDNFEGKFN